MILVLVCSNMYLYEGNFGSFYRNPTILETVLIASKWVHRDIFTEMQRQGVILSSMCLC